MYNDYPSMPQFFLMNSLCIDQSLIEKGTHRRGLVKPNYAVIRLYLL